MKYITTATLTFAAILLLFNLPLYGQSGREQPRRPTLAPGLAARVAANGPARVIVGLDVPAVTGDAARSFAGGRQKSDIAAAQSRLLRRLGGLRLGHVKRFRFTPGVAIEVDYPTLQLLAEQADVSYVIEDQVLKPTLMQSAAIVSATAATAAGYTGRGRTIAVLDTGIDRDHPFLGGRVVAEACFSTTSSTTTALCQSGTTGAGAATPCLNDCDHGTHVAGIAVGRGMLSGTTAQGVAPGATIISIQVFSRQNIGGAMSAFFSDVNLALEHVYSLRTAYDIAAVNMSLGTDAVYANCDAMYPAMKVNIDALRNVGIATIVSSGNSGADNGLSFPACISSTISVGSTMDGSYGAYPVDGVSWFSNSSSGLKLLAPGEFITSSIPTWNGGEAAYSGTSMAAPHVAGAWAVIKSRVPSASVDAVLNALSTTGMPVLDTRNGLVRQRINILAAVKALAPPCTYSVLPQTVSIGAAAADGRVSVETQDGCTWIAVSNSTFIEITGTSSGTGPGAVTFTVGQNTDWAARTGTATIAGQTFTVRQDAAIACTYSVRPSSLSVTSAGGSGTIAVTAPAGCLWSAVAHDSFVTLGNATDRSGSGTLTYAIAANTSTSARTGSATVAGQIVTIRQGAATVNAALQSREHARSDFNRDGFGDLLWQDSATGSLALWMLNGDHTSWSAVGLSQRLLDTSWRAVGTGDFNGDGRPDIVWHHASTGALYLWYMAGTERIGHAAFSLAGESDTAWRVAGVGDFNRDSKPDLVWQHDDGRLAVWLMDGTSVLSVREFSPSRVLDTSWRIAGVGDLNADGQGDLIFEHSGSGELAAWVMNGTARAQYLPFSPSRILDLNWRLAAVLDVDGNQAVDLIWQHQAQRTLAVWYMSGTARTASGTFPWTVGATWMVSGPR